MSRPDLLLGPQAGVLTDDPGVDGETDPTVTDMPDVEVDLTAEEQAALNASAEAVKKTQDSVSL